jgi:hypothetical protein
MQSDLRAFSTTHQKTPWTTTQPQVVNVYHDDNHEPIHHLMKLSLHNNHGDLQPQVTIYLEPMHLHNYNIC